MKGTYVDNLDIKHLKKCVAFAQAYYLLSSFINYADVKETELRLFHARDYICEVFANETRGYVKKNSFIFQSNESKINEILKRRL